MLGNEKNSLGFVVDIAIKHIVVFAQECSYCGRKLDDNGKCPYCG